MVNCIVEHQEETCTPVAAIANGIDSISDCGAGSVILNGIVNDEYFANWYLDGSLYASDTTQIQGFQNGTYVLEVINGACVNRDTIYVSLVPPLNISFTGLDTLYCVYNSTAFLLPNVLGGTFSGPGINLASFNPAIAGEGIHTITYSYTNAQGCSSAVLIPVHKMFVSIFVLEFQRTIG